MRLELGGPIPLLPPLVSPFQDKTKGSFHTTPPWPKALHNRCLGALETVESWRKPHCVEACGVSLSGLSSWCTVLMPAAGENASILKAGEQNRGPAGLPTLHSQRKSETLAKQGYLEDGGEPPPPTRSFSSRWSNSPLSVVLYLSPGAQSQSLGSWCMCVCGGGAVVNRGLTTKSHCPIHQTGFVGHPRATHSFLQQIFMGILQSVFCGPGSTLDP